MILWTKRQKIRFLILFGMLLLFPVLLNYMSPYLIIAGASEGIVNGSALLFLALFLSSLFLGRGWCAWVCPAAGIGDICIAVQNKRVGKKIRWVKWFVWIVWIGFIIMMAISAGGFHKIDPLYMSESFVSLTHPFHYITYYLVLSTILLLSLIVGKRGFCHTVCWMAPFMIIGQCVDSCNKGVIQFKFLSLLQKL